MDSDSGPTYGYYVVFVGKFTCFEIVDMVVFLHEDFQGDVKCK